MRERAPGTATDTLSTFLTGDPVRLGPEVAALGDLVAALGLPGMAAPGLLPLAPDVVLVHSLTGRTGHIALRWARLPRESALVTGAKPASVAVVLTAPITEGAHALRLVARLKACVRDAAVLREAGMAGTREELTRALAAADAAEEIPLSGSEVLALLGSSPEGLPTAEVARRRQTCGENRLERLRRRPLALRFVDRPIVDPAEAAAPQPARSWRAVLPLTSRLSDRDARTQRGTSVAPSALTQGTRRQAVGETPMTECEGAVARYIAWFRDIRLEDLPRVGGKNASLGELYGELTAAGVRVPNGFAVTGEAYTALLDESGLRPRVAALLKQVSGEDVAVLAEVGAEVRRLILEAPWPAGLDREIREAHDTLAREGGPNPAVAVRSSATAEDLPEASFAGQQETYLGVRGGDALIAASRRCFASLFTDRAIVYRIQHGFDHLAVRLSIGVQRMVRADLGAAGVMFTLDPESGSPDVVVINAAYGLGEAVVQGQLDPDEFWVFKPTLRAGHQAILKRALGHKDWKLGFDADGAPARVEVPAAARTGPSVTDAEVLELARLGIAIEAHYSAKAGRPTPMDVEWARDGADGLLYILQARPETVHRAERRPRIEVFTLGSTAGFERLVAGKAIGQRVGAGRARRLRDPRDLARLGPGEVLVAPMTDPDWEPVMKRAAAIVTDRGGRTCHAAIVSRELGVPCIVGTERGTELIPEHEMVTVSCAEGELGAVYRGAVPFDRRTVDLASLPPRATKVLLNVGNPSEAFRLGALPADGVGLCRIEFIIASVVRVHPLALLHPGRVSDPAARAAIATLTRGYADPAEYFVDRLAEGVAVIAAAFYPRDVIVRLSDFKSNEYAGLIGGSAFEPAEANPMLGFRGAYRYTHPRYRDGFALECRAMRRVREDMGLTNIKLMIPFCRTPEEGERVVALMAQHGLRRGERGLEIYVMCEIPSNVLRARDFARIFDGFSIGSNDLTQLVLGVDRDSELVAPIFDERNPAVLAMVASVIDTARAAGRKIGICGQAPSDYPEFTRFLVERGITSISLNPDALVRGLEAIAEAERGVTTPAPSLRTPTVSASGAVNEVISEGSR